MDNLRKGILIKNNVAVGAVGDKYYSSTAIGVIQAFSGNTIPNGYLACNGASYPTADYPDLYAVIGNTYGGDTENFNVPDYRETVLVGVGENTTDTIASHDVYGLGEFKDDQLQEHKHPDTLIYTNIGVDGANSGYVKGNKVNEETGSGSTVNEARSGTTTHGKQKGVTYIIKAFHTNEGVDSGGSGTAGKSAYEIAVDNGFVGTETEWLESLKGEQGEAGRSITGITTDENNNVIVTFSDSSTQNIGQLNIDVQADFLSSEGFGKLRYYNSHFQYYDDATSSWVDTSVTPDNVYVINITPQPMKSIFGVYDTGLGKYKLKFEEPDDTIINGQVACIVEKVVIRRKLGSVPANETDGDLVLEVKRKNFGSYKNNYYIDDALTPSSNDVWYYKAFPVSTTGFYNTSTLNETVGIKCKDYNLYGFKLDQNESDPASMITYLPDCDNAVYKSAYMNYTTDTFDYGDWGDAWFIKNLKPCMLKYDGTVDYELDKNDYTKKADGTDSDVANTAYGGNAMVGFPKVYWKIVDNGDNTANVYICDKKLDDDFVCWSHIDNNGNEIDYCYMHIYEGSLVSGKLRSLSDLTIMVSQPRQVEIDYAKANNIGSDIIWYTEVYSDRVLIELLVLLIGKSTNSQSIFGTGNSNTYVSASNTGIKNSGTMNAKGLFWGNQDMVSGVKVFGVEHMWGNSNQAVAGWICDKGTHKIKMTYGQSDGSVVDGYNLDGTGYVSVAASMGNVNNAFIGKMLITGKGLIPVSANGSATTYYCDGIYLKNSIVSYPFIGGCTADQLHTGICNINFNNVATYCDSVANAALSCKPLATT